MAGSDPNPSLLAGLIPADTPVNEGCNVLWRRQENPFADAMDEAACRIASSRSGPTLVLNKDLVLAADKILILDRGVDEACAQAYGDRADVLHLLG